MKITKEKLKQIIKEELDEKLEEAWLPDDFGKKPRRPNPYDASKEPIKYYYRMQDDTGDPRQVYGKNYEWPQEVQVKNKIAQTMYNLLLHTIPTINKFPELIKQTRKDLAGYGTDEATEASELLESLLKGLKMSMPPMP